MNTINYLRSIARTTIMKTREDENVCWACGEPRHRGKCPLLTSVEEKYGYKGMTEKQRVELSDRVLQRAIDKLYDKAST
jgi:hypothetical protein